MDVGCWFERAAREREHARVAEHCSAGVRGRAHTNRTQFLTGVTSVAAGDTFDIATLSNGSVVDWGDNHAGQLGTGNTTNSKDPVSVTGLSGVTVVQVAAGLKVSYALTSGGNVYAWGEGTNGALGNGTTTAAQKTPVEVCAPGTSSGCATFLSGITQIGAHEDFVVARKSDGTVYAWGNNTYGQLGEGSTTTRTVPVEVCAVSNCSSYLSPSRAWPPANHSSMALTSSGGVYTWGRNQVGQLGSGFDRHADNLPGAGPGQRTFERHRHRGGQASTTSPS